MLIEPTQHQNGVFFACRSRPLPEHVSCYVQVGVIPARYQSVRFPGKPLVKILGKPMIVRTWEQACKARSLSRVVVATDDQQIADVCRAAGAEVVMTSESCPNGDGGRSPCSKGWCGMSLVQQRFAGILHVNLAA